MEENKNNDKVNLDETKQVYFEPKCCCDLKLIYQDTEFYVHKYALAIESEYFKNLFEVDLEVKEITLPLIYFLCDSPKLVICVNQFAQFLHALYLHKVINLFDFQSNLNPECRSGALLSIANYFNVPRLLNIMEIWYIRLFNELYRDLSKPESSYQLLTFLDVSLRLHWTGLAAEIKTFVSANLPVIQSHLKSLEPNELKKLFLSNQRQSNQRQSTQRQSTQENLENQRQFTQPQFTQRQSNQENSAHDLMGDMWILWEALPIAVRQEIETNAQVVTEVKSEKK